MAKDNYFVIRRRPEGGFTYVEALVSDGKKEYDISDSDPFYPRLEDAILSATRLNPAYGIIIHKECYVV